MTDAPEQIWAWPVETVNNLPSWIDELSVGHPDSYVNDDETGVQYTRADLAEQAERNAYARGVADARKVKPLVWVDGDFYCEVRTFGLVFSVTYISGNWWYRGDCCGSLGEAKAAAQSDYERRILSALTDPMQETHNAET